MKNFKVNPGDIVRVVAPSFKGTRPNLVLIRAYIESLGLVPQISDNIYNDEEPLYSNDDEFRANDLISAILDNTCKVIWCIRGGGGSIRVIPYLEKRLPLEPTPTPKLFIGYSDITSLHTYLHKLYNWETLHGPMLEAVVDGTYDHNSLSIVTLNNILNNRLTTITYPQLTRLDAGEPLRNPIQAKLMGGNLTLAENSLGLVWQLDPKDKILFLEDVNSFVYYEERKLDHLKLVGLFNGAKAIVFGDFTNMDEGDELMQFVLRRFAKDPEISCPVFVLTGIGHGVANIPLPLNTSAEIKFDSASLTYQLSDNVPTQG